VDAAQAEDHGTARRALGARRASPRASLAYANAHICAMAAKSVDTHQGLGVEGGEQRLQYEDESVTLINAGLTEDGSQEDMPEESARTAMEESESRLTLQTWVQ